MQSGDKLSNDEIPEDAQEVSNNDYQKIFACLLCGNDWEFGALPQKRFSYLVMYEYPIRITVIT